MNEREHERMGGAGCFDLICRHHGDTAETGCGSDRTQTAVQREIVRNFGL